LANPNYKKSYWRVIRIREKIENGEIKIPYARLETLNKICDLLLEIANAAWKEEA